MLKSEFKSELKELIREVMREEFRDILVEAVGIVEGSKETANINPGFYKPVSRVSKPVASTNPIQAILQETVLSAADRANIGQVGSVAASPFSAVGPVEESDLTNSVLPPFPGLG